ncbi:hypothetical protein HHK36_026615 [Tetracentron sinense]|uniref:Uncharacterized protein n=1 Tax=Tetracentron sinense TaxID=13715 RepID=A0A835D5M7_TETSI|nr:hypothetical protein HHK36_026615 [Tetracentron sinense]
MFRTVVSLERGDPGALRHIALKRLDRELLKGNIKSALSIVKQLQGKTGGLLGFGAARQLTGCLRILSCAAVKSKRLDRRHTYQFLMGLKPKFEALRAQILNTSPMPSLYEAFATVDGDERRHRLLPPTLSPELSPVVLDQIAFAAPSGSRLAGPGEQRSREMGSHTGVIAKVAPALSISDYSQLQSQIAQLQSHFGLGPASLATISSASPKATLATGIPTALHVPQRLYTLDELKLNGMDTLSLQSLVDSILDTIERSIQFCRHDVVSFKELESLMLNATSESLCEENHLMCMQHEAGHFLTAYLLGVLPREYSVPSMEALRKDQFMEGRVKFVGFEFLKEVNAGKMLKKKFNNGNLYAKVNKGKFSSKNLNRFSCIALGGLAAEYLVFGYSEGLHSDVDKLDTLLEWMGFTENEANSHLRWAVLNTILMLHRHHEARSKLAEAMALGRSVGFCIDAIENAINGEDI